MSNLYITTTQNVNLFFTPASVGERMLAHIIDNIIKIAYVIICFIAFDLITGTSLFTLANSEIGIVFIILLSIPVAFYTLLSESLLEGKTPGKMLMKIKVVKIDGFQAGFFDYLIRWVFLLIDITMGYIPGLTALIVSKHTQRIGDLAAGTAVITERSKYNISHTILMEIEKDYTPVFSQNQILLFSDNDIRIIKENFENAIKQANSQIIDRLARKIESILHTQSPLKTDRLLIETLLKDYNYHTGR